MDMTQFGQQLQLEYPVGALAQTQFNVDSEGFPLLNKNSFVLAYTNPKGELKKIVFDLKQIPTDFEDSKAATVIGHYFEGKDLRGEFGGDVLFHKKPDNTIQMKLNVTTQKLTIATLDAIISTDNDLNTALFNTVTTKIWTTVKKTQDRRFAWRLETTFNIGKKPYGSGESGKPGDGSNGIGGRSTNPNGSGESGKPGDGSYESGGRSTNPNGSGESGKPGDGYNGSGEPTSGGPEHTSKTDFFSPDSTKIQEITVIYDNPFSTLHNITEPKLVVDPIVNQVEELPPANTFDQRLKELLDNVNIPLVIESPPTDELFSECEWRDWMSNDYPGRLYEGGEYELKEFIRLDPDAYKKLGKHICGEDPQNAYMIDAVSRDTLTPWREMKYGENSEHQVSHYKVSPYFGYSCVDSNMNTERGCKDMKVRYCCLKKKVASWTSWNQWSTCSVSCGGGKQQRTRKLESCADCVNNGIDERLTKTTRPCNVNNCPVDFTWTEWTPYGDCSKTCGQGGYKVRTRECIPAAHGGEPCPDRELQENKALYQNEEKCTKEDCLVYAYTNWSPWSQCSKTCGKGTKIQTRNCQEKNTLQKAENHFCQTVQDGNLFERKETCLLTHCAVDGGWTDWTVWSECSQDCRAEGASEHEIVDTLAHRKRYKYCTNPMPEHGGKECKKQEGKNVKYDFEQKALVEKGDCESDLPFCPENCKFTEWSEWSECSSTCISSGPAELLKPDDEFSHYEALHIDLENMQIRLKNQYAPLPTRTRVRFELSKAKHGGSCPWTNGVVCVNQTSGKPVNMLEEISTCTLWTAQSDIDTPLEYLKYPATVYPVEEDDKSVLGYCPIDCEWGEWEQTTDCCAVQEDVLDDYNNCFYPSILEYMKGFNGHPKEKKNYASNVKAVFDAIKAAKENLDQVELLLDYEDYGQETIEGMPQLPQLKGPCLKKKLRRAERRKCYYNRGMSLKKLEQLWEADVKTMKDVRFGILSPG